MGIKQPVCVIDEYGDKRWKLNGNLHNEHGPAIEFVDGTKCWYINNQCHRFEVDLKTGLLLPAIEWNDGSKNWYMHGKTHRDEIDPETGLSLPAMTYPDGSGYWYKNNLRHRDDGPAIENPNGIKQYWIDGKYIQKLDNRTIYGKENLAAALLLL